MTSRRVLILQPYIPSYRVPFFQQLAADLAGHDVALTVAHGRPAGQQAHRGDAVDMPGAVAVPQHAFTVAGRLLLWRRLGKLAGKCDAVVLEQALKNIETYPLLARARLRRGPAVCLWGHGRTHDRSTAVAGRVKDALTCHADWFFAYTEAAAEHVVRAGMPAGRVTVVRNSTDTAALLAALARVTPQDVQALRTRLGLTSGRTALFLGGLDRPKRIPFLLEAAELTARRLPGFRLLVAGDGSHRPLVEEAAARPGSSVTWLGPVTDTDAKALLGASCEVLLMPGAVGLAAVDALALSTPVITTPGAGHGPEFAYLEHDRNALVVPGGEQQFADAVAALLDCPNRLDSLRRAGRQDLAGYSTEAMSARFTQGLLQLLGDRTRTPRAAPVATSPTR